MTEEEKIAEAEAKAIAEKAKAEEEAANAQKAKGEIDYEAELALEREKRQEAEKAAAELAYKLRDNKRKEEKEIEDEIDDEDKPLTSKDLQNLEDRIINRNEKLSQETKALEIARMNTSSEAEAQLALLKWKDVKSTGDLEKDILFAIGGINYKKVIAANAELKRALKSKEGISSDDANTHFDGQKKDDPKLPENSPLKEYKYMGKGIYAKKLKSGKTIFKNTRAISGQPKMWIE